MHCYMLQCSYPDDYSGPIEIQIYKTKNKAIEEKEKIMNNFKEMSTKLLLDYKNNNLEEYYKDLDAELIIEDLVTDLIIEDLSSEDEEYIIKHITYRFFRHPIIDKINLDLDKDPISNKFTVSSR